MRKIPFIFCIDVEPDERQIDVTRPEDWKGFEEAFKLFTEFRLHLQKATGANVSFSWFFRMDPQIERTYGQAAWVVGRYGEVIKRLEQSGDELGLHTHIVYWDQALGKWVIDYGDQKWIDHCLHTSFEAYRSAFGRPCLSFRFGDHWMNNETMNSLETMGVEFDLTIEPGRRERTTLCTGEVQIGSLPDYTTTPRWPYKPSREDFRKYGDEHARVLWVIPVSSGKEPGRFAAVKQMARTLGIDLQRRHEEAALNLYLGAPGFGVMLDRLLDLNRKPYLAPVLRTDSCIHPRYRTNVEQNLNRILSHPMVSNFRFVRPAEAIRLLNQPGQG